MRLIMMFVLLVGCDEAEETASVSGEQPEDRVVEESDDPVAEEEEEVGDPAEEEEEVEDPAEEVLDVDTDGDGLTDAQEAAFGSDPNKVDTDEDGLTDNVEFELDTDPTAADTDGDGYSDSIEVAFETDPKDVDSVVYLGGWPVDDCYDRLEPTGNAIGDVTDDFSLMDQYGETVQLHHFCGHAVLLISAAMWCPVCQDEAPHMQTFYEDLEEMGLFPITLLGKNTRNQTPTQADLQTWADTFGLTHPVVADPSWGVTARFLDSSSFGIPTLHLIGFDGVVQGRDRYYTFNQLRTYLASEAE
ncbi:MAG: redoxin domain-containing protein [Myxococcota bacterium]